VTLEGEIRDEPEISGSLVGDGPKEGLCKIKKKPSSLRLPKMGDENTCRIGEKMSEERK